MISTGNKDSTQVSTFSFTGSSISFDINPNFINEDINPITIKYDWGDRNINRIKLYNSTIQHTYTQSNLYQIKITGQYVIVNSLLSNYNFGTDVKYIDLSNNNLITLPTLPDIKTLFCDNNSLSTLTISPNITRLSCSGNTISSLTLPTGLTYLNCSYNNISTLNIPNSLTYLSCRNNNLTSLLATGLTYLDCSNNNISTLSLSTGLTYLNCENNDLTQIDEILNIFINNNLTGGTINLIGNSIPSNITGLTYIQTLTNRGWNILTDVNPTLDYTNLGLSSLPNIPNGTINLYCSGNTLTSLPILPNSLQTLICNNNVLTNLSLSSGLTYIDCSNNLLTNLSLPSGITYINCNNNPLTTDGIDNILSKLVLNNLNSGYCYLVCNNYPSDVSGLFSRTVLINRGWLVDIIVKSVLNYSNMKLGSIPNIPDGVVNLYCDNNSLSVLPVLPSSIRILNCDNNSLTSLPSLSIDHQVLSCNNNLITTLGTLSTGLTYLSAFNNYIPLDEVESILINLTNSSNCPNLGYLDLTWQLPVTTLTPTGNTVTNFKMNRTTILKDFVSVVRGGMVLYLDATNNKSFTDGPAVWKDLSLNRNNCVYISAPTFDGKSFTFNGTTNYSLCGNSVMMDFSTDDFSVIAYINPINTYTGNSGTLQDYSVIVDKGTGGLIDGYGLWFSGTNTPGGTRKICFTTDGDGGSGDNRFLNSTTQLSLKNWYYVVVLRRSGIKYIYINSTQESNTQSDVRETSDVTRPLTIGMHDYDAGGFFNGQISIVSIYNRALTQSEIDYNYNVMRDKVTCVLNLDVANPNSYNGSGTIWYDTSGSGYNGTLSTVFYSTGNGGYFQFNGTNSYITLGSVTPNLYPTTGDFTWNGWLNFGGYNGTGKYIWQGNAGGGYAGFGFGLLSVSNSMSVEINGSPSFSRQDFNLSVGSYLNQWHHWTFVIVQSTFRVLIYVDSVYITTLQCVDWGSIASGLGIYGGGSTICALLVGAFGSVTGSGGFYDGKIAQVQVHNVALTQSEITDKYNLTKDRYSTQTPIFTFDIVSTQLLTGLFSTVANKAISVDWGDGSGNSYIGTDKAYSKDYGSVGNRTVKIYADTEYDFTKFRVTSTGSTVNFDIGTLPSGITYLSVVSETSTLSGDVSGLPRNMTHLYTYGTNTITGDVSGLPRTLNYLEITGNNTLSGDVSGLPITMIYFYVYGQNTISGDVSGLPSNLTELYVQGHNTLSGDVSGLPEILSTMIVYGQNTITGNVSGLPSNLIGLYLQGYNTLSGDVAGLPTNILNISLYGYNTITGDVINIPRNLSRYCRIIGSNTLSGNIANLPISVREIRIEGDNTISDYTSGRTWNNSIVQFIITPNSGGLSQTEVDWLLADLNTSWTTLARNVSLDGTNAAPSTTGLLSKTALEGKGCTVSVNT